MDMTVVLHQFSPQATMDHHVASMYSGHYATIINCCKNSFYSSDSKIAEFEIVDTQNSSTAYAVIYMYQLIT